MWLVLTFVALIDTPLDDGSEHFAQVAKDQGLDVEITNWHGVVAPPDIKPAERDAAIAAMAKLHDSPEERARAVLR